jgi:hypothetical protein
MPRYAVRRLEDVPRIPLEPDNPQWYPVQHYFGITAFGVNIYVAETAGIQLLGEHDEAGSNREEVYLVTSGEATFTLDGETFDAPAVTVVAVPNPTVRRVAYAKVANTAVIAMGGRRQLAFESSWQPNHF